MPNNSPFNINARLRLSGPDGLDSVVSNLQKAFARPISVNASLNSNGFKAAAKDIENTGKALERIKSASEQAGEVFGATARRFGTFVVVSKIFNIVSDSIGRSITEAVKFQHEMVRLAQIGGTSAAAIADISQEIGRLSTTMGASSKELSEVSVTLRQAGFAANEVKIAMDALAKTSLAPTFDSIKDTTEGVIAMRQQFGVSAEEIERRLGAINTVAGEFAVESQDIVTGIKKAGAAFKAASGDFSTGEQAFNQFISLFTSVRNTTRESAEEIATGMRTIFARVQSNSVSNSLKDMGINLRFTAEEAKVFGKDVTGQFVGAYEAVRRLSAATRNLPTTDPRFTQIVEQLGGFRQISRVIPLLQQFGTAQKAYTIAQAGANSLTLDAAKAQDSLIVKTGKLTESMNELLRTFLDNKGIQTMVSGFLDIATAAAQFAKALEPIAPLIAVIGAAKLGSGLRDFSRGAFNTVKLSAAAPPTPRLRRATGGVIPGVGRGDKVPMDVPAGSYILKRDSAKKIGYDNLNAWMGNRYATGGSVQDKVPILTEPGEFFFDNGMVQKLGLANLNRANQTGELPKHLADLSDADPRNKLAKKLWRIGGMKATLRRYASGGLVTGQGSKRDKPNLLKKNGGKLKELREQMGFARGGKVPAIPEDEIQRRIAAMNLSGEFASEGPALAEFFNTETGSFDIGQGGKASKFYKIIDRLAKNQQGADTPLSSVLKQLGSQSTAKDLTSTFMEVTGKTKIPKNLRDLTTGSKFLSEHARQNLPKSGVDKTLSDLLIKRTNDNTRKAIKQGGLSGGDAHSKSVNVNNIDDTGVKHVVPGVRYASSLIQGSDSEKAFFDELDARETSPGAATTLTAREVDPSLRYKKTYSAANSTKAATGGGISARLRRRKPPATNFAPPAPSPSVNVQPAELWKKVAASISASGQGQTPPGLEVVIKQLMTTVKDSIKTQKDNTSAVSQATKTESVSRIKKSRQISGVLAGKLKKAQPQIDNVQGSIDTSGDSGYRVGTYTQRHKTSIFNESRSGSILKDSTIHRVIQSLEDQTNATQASKNLNVIPTHTNANIGVDFKGSTALSNNAVELRLKIWKQAEEAVSDFLKDSAEKAGNSPTIDVPLSVLVGQAQAINKRNENRTKGIDALVARTGIYGNQPKAKIFRPDLPVPMAMQEGENNAFDAYSILSDESATKARKDAYNNGVMNFGKMISSASLLEYNVLESQSTNSTTKPAQKSRPVSPYDLLSEDENNKRIAEAAIQPNNNAVLAGSSYGILHPRHKQSASSLTDYGGERLDIQSEGGYELLNSAKAERIRNFPPDVFVDVELSVLKNNARKLSEKLRDQETREADRIRLPKETASPTVSVREQQINKFYRDQAAKNNPNLTSSQLDEAARVRTEYAIRNDLKTVNPTGYNITAIPDPTRKPKNSLISNIGKYGNKISQGVRTSGAKIGSNIGKGGRYLFQKGGGVGGVGGLLSSAALYSDYLSKDTTENTVEGIQRNASGRQRRSAATFGGIGFQLGSMTGNPVVAALGTVAGSIYGAVSEFENIAKDISKIKLDESLRKLGTTLNGLNNGRIDKSGGVVKALNRSISDVSNSTSGVGGSQYNFGDKVANFIDSYSINAGGAESGLISQVLRGTLGSSNETRVKGEFEARRAKEQEVLQPILPGIRDTFQRSLISSGKIGTNLVTSNNSTDANAQKQARQAIILANGGHQLIDTISRVQKQSFDQVLNEFDQEVIQAGRAKVSETAGRDQANQIDLDTRRFERLGSAIDNATFALHGLEKTGDLIAGLAGGRVGSSSITGISGQISQIGGLDKSAASNTVRFAANTLGNGPGGSVIKEFSTLIGEMDEIKRSLSGRLTQAAKGGSYNEESVIGDIGDAFNGFSPATQKKLKSTLNSMDPKTVLQELTANPDKLADQISSAVFGEVDKVWDGIVKGLEDQSARFAAGLGKGQELRSISLATSDKTSGLALDRENSFNALTRNVTGRDVSTPLSSLLNPFNDRQTKLGGFNVDRIRSRLGDVTKESERQQAIVQNVGTSGDARKKAQEELLKLSNQAADLNKALEGLSDTSSRLAAINQKIAESEKVRDSQTSLAERLITGDPSSQYDFNRGLSGAEVAGNQGDLSGFNGQEAKLVLDTLRSFGDIQFKTGPFAGFTGTGAADRLLVNSTKGARGPWGGDLDATNTTGEISDLQKMTIGIQTEAIKANDALADYQKSLADRFFTNLNDGYNKFFAETNRRLSEANLKDKTTASNIDNVELDKRKNTFNKIVGVDNRFRLNTRDNGLARARGLLASPELATLGQGLKDQQSLLFDKSKLASTVNDLDTSFGDTGDLKKRDGREAFLEKYRQKLDGVGNAIVQQTNLPRKAVDEGLNKYLAEVTTKADSGSLDGFDHKKVLTSSLNKAVTDSQTENTKIRSDAMSRLKWDNYDGRSSGKIEEDIQYAALNRDDLNSKLAGTDSITTKKQAAQELFDQAKVTVQSNHELAEATKAATDATVGLTDAVKQTQTGEPVQHKSLGGPVFSPRGSDTIPAMLTKGEYIVPANVARTNLPLLKSLRPEYRANGGLVGYKQEWEKRREEQIKRQEDLIKAENMRLNERQPRLDAQVPQNARGIGPSAGFLASLKGENRPLSKTEQHARRRQAPGSYRRAFANILDEGYTGAVQANTPRGRQLMDDYRRTQTPKRRRKRYKQTSPWEVRGYQSDEENFANSIMWGNIPFGFSAGGVVPNRGTDTIPTMLTAGEMVIPKNIAQTHRQEIQRMTQYRADGGPDFQRSSPVQTQSQTQGRGRSGSYSEDTSAVTELVKAQRELSSSIPSLVKSLTSVIEPFNNLANALNNNNLTLPDKIDVSVNGTQSVTVNTANMDGAIKQIVNEAIHSKITEGIANYFNNKLSS